MKSNVTIELGEYDSLRDQNKELMKSLHDSIISIRSLEKAVVCSLKHSESLLFLEKGSGIYFIQTNCEVIKKLHSEVKWLQDERRKYLIPKRWWQFWKKKYTYSTTYYNHYYRDI